MARRRTLDRRALRENAEAAKRQAGETEAEKGDEEEDEGEDEAEAEEEAVDEEEAKPKPPGT